MHHQYGLSIPKNPIWDQHTWYGRITILTISLPGVFLVIVLCLWYSIVPRLITLLMVDVPMFQVSFVWFDHNVKTISLNSSLFDAVTSF